MRQKKNVGKQRARSSIKKDLLLATVIPIALIFSLVCCAVLYQTANTAKVSLEKEINEETVLLAETSNSFFEKYIAVARQAEGNPIFVHYLTSTQSKADMFTSPYYGEALRLAQNIHNNDVQDILVTWLVDVENNYIFEDAGWYGDDDWDMNTRAWYAPTVASDGIHITDPYVSVATGQSVVSILTQVHNPQGKLIGIYAVDLDISVLPEIMSSRQLGTNGSATLIDRSGTIISHRNEDLVFTKFSDSGYSQNIKDAVVQGDTSYQTFTWEGNEYQGQLAEVGDTGWYVLSQIPSAELTESIGGQVTGMLVLFAIGLVLLIILMVKEANKLGKPVDILTVAAEKIADGHFDVDLDIHTHNEIGVLADAFQRTVHQLQNYQGYIDEITRSVNHIADGQLVIHLQRDYQGQFSSIKAALENLSDQLAHTIGNVSQAIEQVSNGAEQIANGAGLLAEGAISQTGEVNQISKGVQEIVGSARENSDRAADALHVTGDMEQQVNDGQDKLANLLQAMNNIERCSAEITKIINVINEISTQTKMLALNASIEAARAGEAGKGFNVVAEEISSLAGRTTEAVNMTATIIQSSNDAIAEGREFTDEVKEALEGIVGQSSEVSEIVQLIAQRSVAQLAQLDELAQGMDNIQRVVETNSATAQQSAAASEELNGQADSLTDLISVFKW